MTAWAEILQDIADVQIDAFGETVTLADGTQIQAVVTITNPPGFGLEVGFADRFSQQAQMTIALPDAAASTHSAQLARGQRLTVRVADYLVADDPDADGNGCTHIPLNPAPALP